MKAGRVASLFGVVLLLVVFAFSLPALQAEDAYPSKAIKWIVPYSPGGGYDVYSRAVAKYMPKYLPGDAPIVIINAPGAGGTVGVTKVYNSKPDGYTIGIMNSVGVAAASVLKDLGIKVASLRFDPTELTYIGVITQNIYTMMVAPTSRYQSIKAMQAAPEVKFPNTGVGSTAWSHTVLTAAALGIKAKHISGYPGMTQGRLSVLSGDTDASLDTVGSNWTQIKSGELNPLFYIKPVKKYFPEAPDRPTAAELGYPDLEKFCGFWRHVIAPPGVSPKVAGMLEDALWKTLHDPEFVAWSQETRRPLILPCKAAEAREIMIKLMGTYKEKATVFKNALAQ